MSELYRFKFRSDLFEIELESTDSDFINKQIMQLIEMSTRPLEDRPKLLAAYSSSKAEAEAEAEEAPAEEAMAEEEPATEEAEAAPAVEKPRPKPRRKSSGRKKTAAPAKAAAKKAPKKAPAAKTSSPKKTAAPAKAAAKKAPKKAPAAKTSGINPNQIADYVKSSENFELFQNKILNKANQLNRILLSFYFAEKAYGKKGLTTGDIESITEALGSSIKSTNVSSQLKKHDQLFNSRGERKRGSVVHYKLNKKGKDKFEELIKE
jgi:chemotaxis protein histidine kinase CheA